MAGWGSRRIARAPAIQRGDTQALFAILVLAAALGIYGYKYWYARPPLTGTVWVSDGDSLEIAGARIRLEGIDAPELNQTCTDARGQTWSCGRTAAHELRALIAGRDLRCEPNGTDRYRRVLAVCFLPDGTDVNGWMVRNGWAVAYGYASAYRSAQDEAKVAKRGIWAGSFTSPADWRQRQ